jgi:MFS family permease
MKESAISSKKLASVIILVSTSFAWLFIFFVFFKQIFDPYLTSSSTYYNCFFFFLGAAAFSAIAGSVIGERVNRRKFFVFWIILGLLANISLLFVQNLGLIYFYFISAILGVSIALGFPSCLSFLAESTKIEERARVSGITILGTLLIVIFSYLFASTIQFGIGVFILLCFIRASTLLTFAFDSCERHEAEKVRPWLKVFTSKDFFLYLFPWLMFSFMGSLMDIVFRGINSPEITNVATIGDALHFLSWAAFGLISGILADRIGRRQPIMIGLVMFGAGFALMSFILTPATVIAYDILSGVAWGFLFTVYISVLGDLAVYGSKERFYAMGAIMPLILTFFFNAITLLLGVTLSASILPILSLLLFLSILPVLRASETLPRKKQEARKLKEHLDKVGKLIQEDKRKT